MSEKSLIIKVNVIMYIDVLKIIKFIKGRLCIIRIIKRTQYALTKP